MKKRLLSIAVIFLLALAVSAVPTFAYSHPCEDINFNKLDASDWTTAGGKGVSRQLSLQSCINPLAASLGHESEKQITYETLHIRQQRSPLTREILDVAHGMGRASACTTVPRPPKSDRMAHLYNYYIS